MILKIERVTANNYHLFDDMIYWRINGKEKQNSKIDFSLSKEIRDELNNENLYIQAMVIDSKMVGWISMIYMPKVGKYNGRGHIYIDELWIEPTYRGKGLAGHLMLCADDLNKTLNATGIRLYVSGDNDAARSLYENCGYKYADEALFMTKYNS
jgi:ribosomal protein S18 acetylase RimI-like enzyme